MFYGIPFDTLNKTVTRKRPIQTISPRGGITLGSYELQTVQMRILERRARGGGHNAEKDMKEGIVTDRTFLFDCNYFTDATLTIPTDIVPTDLLEFTDATGVLLCRIADLHDAAGQNHHISGEAIYSSPTGG